MAVFFHQIVLQCLFFFAVCCAPNRAPMSAFFGGLSCTKSCSNAFFFFAVCRAPNRGSDAFFFWRFVLHQIVLQCVFFFFFAVCSAPNRAPMRAFFLRFVVNQNRVLLCSSCPGVSFGKLLLVVSLQRLQSSIFHQGIDHW